jgi:fatty-acyl-CoA synthase
VIQSSGLTTEVAIVTVPDSQRGEAIVACVVLSGESGVEPLRRFCGVELPRYMQPARFVVLPAIPRNASGKHDLQQLKRLVSSPDQPAGD